MSKEYLRPGVFVEEVPADAVPIEGVGTSTGGFLGVAERGAMNTPKLVTSFSQYTKHFGGYRADSFLTYALRGFFDNKGSRCYVVRVSPAGAVTASVDLPDRATVPVDTLRVQALNEGVWGNGLTVTVTDGTDDPTNEFDLIVKRNGEVVEPWRNLSMDDASERFVETVVNGNSNYIQVTDLDSGSTAPDDRPAEDADIALSGGADGTEADGDYVGDEPTRTGRFAFDTIEDVNTLATPGKHSPTVVQAMLDYCENRKDCHFVADPQAGRTPSQVKTYREAFDSSRGFLFYPWLSLTDPVTGRSKVVPPSGHVIGVMARTDSTRGVHKAPGNETVMGITGLEYVVTNGEQEVLNPVGVNCIRQFKRRGIRVWGARTLSSDATLRYIHKRRLLTFIEKSVDEGTQWAPFEPNDKTLWGKIIRSVGAFLRRQWLEGALYGTTAGEAYYVKCNDETNPPEERAAGKVITEVGVRIVETAEFVVFRVGQWNGGSSVTEL